MNALEKLPMSIGPHNQGVMEMLARAKRVALELARHGGKVHRLVATTGTAHLVIEPPKPGSPLALMIDEAGRIQSHFARTPVEQESTWETILEGVRVEWTARGWR